MAGSVERGEGGKERKRERIGSVGERRDKLLIITLHLTYKTL